MVAAIGLLLSFVCVDSARAKEFVVVIDAGHGGNDPGAVGRISKEKTINLNVALKVGRLIEANCPDVKVVYTRKRDVFIPLGRRADIANDAKADLFISIHTNALANNRVATGASTWTLGLAKSEANLDVAKRENSVILYEDDYKTRYAGFDPNSAESYIIFEFMQDKYMKQSVDLASLVQKQFKQTCKRPDRGVHQAGFLVLKASAMPSILVELGFISTPEEERFLNSEAGANTMANGIYRAFVAYKSEQELRLTGGTTTPEPRETSPEADTVSEPKPTGNEMGDESRSVAGKAIKSETRSATRSATKSDEITFKIQILTTNKPLPKGDRRLKGLEGVSYYREKGLYKYTYGSSTDYDRMLKLRRSVAPKFKDAFIIAFRGDEKMDIKKAIAEFRKQKK
ncbi:MAG: N-acetylmuramoyl-L-alanine amidase [Mediterranea sp.]|jgi:N-acetylmuramoyl-L-alanine amidase|nr:N-acetylmuramoyl-L-alanine amidase [Mediterranea sp.]